MPGVSEHARVLAQTVPDAVAAWVWTLAFALAPGLVAAVVWSPVLASERLRALFRTLPPTGSLGITYPVVAVALSLPYLGAFLGALAATADGSGAAIANAVLGATALVSVVYIVGGPVVAAVGLPRLGVDWDSNGYDGVTWLLLVAASAWYAAIFAVPFFVFSIFAALPT